MLLVGVLLGNIKKMLNLPSHTSHDLVKDTFCGNSIKNIIQKFDFEIGEVFKRKI